MATRRKSKLICICAFANANIINVIELRDLLAVLWTIFYDTTKPLKWPKKGDNQRYSQMIVERTSEPRV